MDEVTALFELVGDEFGGDLVSTMPYTPQPEGSMVGVLDDARGQFNVTVGSYPAIDGRNRLKMLSTDADAIAERRVVTRARRGRRGAAGGWVSKLWPIYCFSIAS